MGILKKFFNMTRKPEGFLGKMMLKGMNGGHTPMADWGMNKLSVSPSEIIELGCGGGRNIDALLKRYDKAKVTGIDYSPLSVSKSREYNVENIKNGRCEIKEADVSDLKLPENKYDLATAFETVYFWPGIEKCFGEVYKVLAPGGTFLIVNEADGEDTSNDKWEKIIEGMKTYNKDELSEALKKAGFSEISCYHHDTKPWIAVSAKK